MEDKKYPLIRRFCAVVIGVVFFVAGMLKLMDPSGAALKVQDYLAFFHMPFLTGCSRLIAVALALLEAFCGAALISGVWRRITAAVTVAMLGFFTILTAILFFSHAGLDCGCFAEAVRMTPLQSLLKNVALCLLALAAFVPVGSYGSPRKPKYAGFALGVICASALCAYSLSHLPLVDYSDFAPGCSLISASAASPQVEGEALMLVDDEGWGRDDRLLYGKKMTVSVFDAAGLGAAQWADISSFFEGAYGCGIETCLIVSADSRDAVPDYLEAPVYTADARKLMALNRSNGGVTYLEDGMVICKWKLRDAPGRESLIEVAQNNSTEMMVERSTFPKLVFDCLLIVPLALMFIV